MIQKMLRAITARYHLNAIPLGQFTKMKLGTTEFQLWAFHADGLGHVSALTASGFLGLNVTQVLILNPTERDMPLYICRRVRKPGSDSLRIARVDTLVEPDPEKCIQTQEGEKCPAEDRALEALEEFLDAAAVAPYCDPAAKKEKAYAYVEGMLAQGREARLFQKAMGQRDTSVLLHHFLFGTTR